MEMAMPASDMMFTVTPIQYSGMKAKSTEIGMVKMGTKAEGICQRKSIITAATMIISTVSSWVKVSMARFMRSERS